MRTEQRLAESVLAAARELERAEDYGTGPAEPGDLFVLPLRSDTIGLEWLVVRVHPDTADTVLLVPVDTAPFWGVCSVWETGSVQVARCSLSVWVSRSVLVPALRVGRWDGEKVSDCRVILHRLATGADLDATPQQRATECDPNYQAHLNEVARAVVELESLA